ncbi:phosphopantetheine-binding protein [Falsiroseomonas tokyonensis]|uniref:Phosphopantetheine-binding protein n=1 Tax=Falsiroseomonas tokyonensis TaxID=430521 RepID=A0ABV7BXJ6_9PROT|nr:phosphopantetheine-binding protein [Falsiroseomonas tokyonensis]MBU8540384.1 phosphopantetheine-binding protein [Falsiroseomonas tokyonensis]
MAMTQERMRADLARVLRMPPEEIGDEEDLIDLGLDSMRAMALLTRWAEAGAPLELAAVAEKVTLGAWWALAQRAMSSRRDA